MMRKHNKANLTIYFGFQIEDDTFIEKDPKVSILLSAGIELLTLYRRLSY